MRGLYSLLWYAALPVAPLRLLWRGRREPGYREHVGERYGRYRGTVPPRILWVHAVSLGETRAAAPLVERLRRAYPDATLLLTHMTATGRATGRALFGDGVLQAWLPYDAPFAVRRFLAHFKPCAGLIMETELWPNLVALSREAGVPIYLVNARMSERSARLYAAFPALTRPMLAALSGVAAQTDADAARLAALGAPGAVVTGNMKFDVARDERRRGAGREFRARFGETRPVWVAASTRDGEEAMILDALAARELPHGALTVIVPRHPQRFAAVADLLRQRGIPFVLRSSNAPVTADVEVVLGDSMGEMAGLLRGRRRRVRRRQPASAGRTEPDRADRRRDGRRSSVRTCSISPTRRRRRWRPVPRSKSRMPLRSSQPSRRCSTTRRAGRRCATAALAFHAAHHGAADRLAAWLAPRLDAAIAATRNAGARTVSPSTGD